jgi:hypothetical protein
VNYVLPYGDTKGSEIEGFQKKIRTSCVAYRREHRRCVVAK